jgi:hypothetical protein
MYNTIVVIIVIFMQQEVFLSVYSWLYTVCIREKKIRKKVMIATPPIQIIMLMITYINTMMFLGVPKS